MHGWLGGRKGGPGVAKFCTPMFCPWAEAFGGPLCCPYTVPGALQVLFVLLALQVFVLVLFGFPGGAGFVPVLEFDEVLDAPQGFAFVLPEQVLPTPESGCVNCGCVGGGCLKSPGLLCPSGYVMPPVGPAPALCAPIPDCSAVGDEIPGIRFEGNEFTCSKLD